MGWSYMFQCSKYLSEAYQYCTANAEVVLLTGVIVLLLLRRKLRAALVLAFAVTLCFGNYFMFTEYKILSFSLAYSAALAGVSIFLLLLLVYQFIDSV